jgi:hypothetical protein
MSEERLAVEVAGGLDRLAIQSAPDKIVAFSILVRNLN